MINVCGVPVENEHHAEILMLHHLRLAAQYFEATPMPLKLPQDEFSSVAMAAWANAMEGLYPDD